MAKKTKNEEIVGGAKGVINAAKGKKGTLGVYRNDVNGLEEGAAEERSALSMREELECLLDKIDGIYLEKSAAKAVFEPFLRGMDEERANAIRQRLLVSVSTVNSSHVNKSRLRNTFTSLFGA